MFLKFDVILAGAAATFYMNASYTQFLVSSPLQCSLLLVSVVYKIQYSIDPVIKNCSVNTLVLNSLMHSLEQDPDSNTKSSIAMSLR